MGWGVGFWWRSEGHSRLVTAFLAFSQPHQPPIPIGLVFPFVQNNIPLPKTFPQGIQQNTPKKCASDKKMITFIPKFNHHKSFSHEENFIISTYSEHV